VLSGKGGWEGRRQTSVSAVQARPTLQAAHFLWREQCPWVNLELPVVESVQKITAAVAMSATSISSCFPRLDQWRCSSSSCCRSLRSSLPLSLSTSCIASAKGATLHSPQQRM